MKKNARYILYFFIVMISIVSVRIALFFIYDIQKFETENGEITDKDDFLEVIFINLTEIALVITVTKSVKWSLVAFQ